MPEIASRMGILVREHEKDLPILIANAKDKEKDSEGSASMQVALSLRFLGIAKYFLEKDVPVFQEYLSRAVFIRRKVMERFQNGEPISPSYVTMLNYQWIFAALAAGNKEEARLLSSLIGGRDKIEKQHDHPFDYAFGYAVKSFVLDQLTEMSNWAGSFSEVCQKSENRHFRGYPTVFDAILANDSGLAEEGFKAIVNGHEKLSKGRRIFKGTADEVLCVWGLGMANLARSHGLEVKGIAPLIPPQLLV